MKGIRDPGENASLLKKARRKLPFAPGRGGNGKARTARTRGGLPGREDASLLKKARRKLSSRARARWERKARTARTGAGSRRGDE